MTFKEYCRLIEQEKQEKINRWNKIKSENNILRDRLCKYLKETGITQKKISEDIGINYIVLNKFKTNNSTRNEYGITNDILYNQNFEKLDNFLKENNY